MKTTLNESMKILDTSALYNLIKLSANELLNRNIAIDKKLLLSKVLEKLR